MRPESIKMLRALFDPARRRPRTKSGEGRRSVPPSRTIKRLRDLSPKMGITRVANVTGLDRIGIPVVMVCRPLARSLAVSQGKGVDLESAIAAGLMEAAELYHAEHIELPLKLGSQFELQSTHSLVDVSRLAHVAGSRFDQNLVMLWIEGVDLISRASRWVPFECVRTNFTLPPPPGSGCFDCSSNGLASGSTLADAVRHGVCEVIERDATTLWNGLSREDRSATGVDLQSVEDTRCREVLGKLERAGFGVAVWETTSDVAIPSFFALISDRRNPANHHGIGAAAHPDRDVALLKAVVEAAQVRTTYISGARDDLLPSEYDETGRAAKRRAARRLLAGHDPVRRFRDIPSWTSTRGSEIELLLGRLKSVGIAEVVVVDLSKPELGLAVVRCVIPGLEGPDDHARYVPGPRALRATSKT